MTENPAIEMIRLHIRVATDLKADYKAQAVEYKALGRVELYNYYEGIAVGYETNLKVLRSNLKLLEDMA